VTVDWAGVYRETYQDLVRFLHRKVWDADRAQDLAQEAFMRALDHEPDNPKSFIFTIAANLARDEARAAIRRRRHLTLIKAEAEDRSTVDPVQDLEHEQRVASVRRALDLLSDRDREVLLLWDAGLNYEEIAEQTGLAAKAIGTTLSRARRRLVEAHEALEDRDVAHR
jgi:RNA polymerase sigma-70 factor (ECF subfamily)